jgi:hypothetical protein
MAWVSLLLVVQTLDAVRGLPGCGSVGAKLPL